MTEVGNIVTLENGKEYLLLETLIHEEKNYWYSVRTLEDDTPTDEYMIFEGIIDNGEEYLKPVMEKELYDDLMEEFRDVVADKLMSGEYEDFMEEIEEQGEAA